ncbi:dienelactone hydrolase [Paenibacillus turicensis]|uniref:Dienelactone hydrolase n=1 Tax=Paenibacillus turicensis TaxID=160487 RepID=A0ABS4FLN5_9BACL|nr:alpha/beta hydrolase [Paenibacillus turicensis]MBP1903503.1 dienelactone hydrolase [Paenibacillus turicensis]
MSATLEPNHLQSKNTKVKRSLTSILLGRIKRTFQFDTLFWRTAMIGSWSVTILTCLFLALSLPTGFGVTLDLMLFSILGTAIFWIVSHLLAVIIALTGIKVPRLYVATLICNVVSIFFIFYEDDSSLLISILFASLLSIGGMIIGLLWATLLCKNVSSFWKFTILTCFLIILTANFIPDLISITTQSASNQTADRASNPVADGATDSASDFDLDSVSDLTSVSHFDVNPAEGVADSALTNPALTGIHAVSYFTYGSGSNRRLDEFGANVDVNSNPVDASQFISNWSWYRTFFWGFDETTLPLNGRVWMPEEDGKYPLVLLVHGNHIMEEFSDEGYNYLGQLLASRGFVAVSIDENFLNYSNYSGIPTNDMKVRAWILLQHLMQIEQFNQAKEVPLYNKIDMQNIAIMGHSRGGQAAAMAADGASWFKDEQLQQFTQQYPIKTVIAIAPTDKQVDKKYTDLKNINYLTIQGAMDGDVSDFDGERQYARTTFNNEKEKSTENPWMKSTLYVEAANHSQFNSEWGSRDISLPQGLFLRHSDIIDTASQQEIAKVYVTAFLEATLKNKQAYVPLFQDYRNGEAWLPASTYFNRYEDSTFVVWSTFEENMSQTALPSNGSIIASGVTTHKEAYKNRSQSSKNSKGLKVEWGNSNLSSPNEVASLSLNWKQGTPTPATKNITRISFSLANLNYLLENTSGAMEIDVEVYDVHGNKAILPLSQFQNILEPPESTFTWYKWMDDYINDGKYEEDTEAIMQTFILPLQAYTQNNPKLDVTSLGGITFHMKSSSGLIMLDDIGVY